MTTEELAKKLMEVHFYDGSNFDWRRTATYVQRLLIEARIDEVNRTMRSGIENNNYPEMQRIAELKAELERINPTNKEKEK